MFVWPKKIMRPICSTRSLCLCLYVNGIHLHCSLSLPPTPNHPTCVRAGIKLNWTVTFWGDTLSETRAHELSGIYFDDYEPIGNHYVRRYLEQVYASGTGIRRHPLFFMPHIKARQEAAEAKEAALHVSNQPAFHALRQAVKSSSH